MLLNIVDVAMINKQIISNALNSEFKDFEGTLQNFSAQNEKSKLTASMYRELLQLKHMATLFPTSLIQ